MHSLIKPAPTGDVIEVLEQLLEGARDGQVIGLAYTAMLKRRRFMTGALGECHRDPTFARGIVATLDDELAGLVHRRAAETTT